MCRYFFLHLPLACVHCVLQFTSPVLAVTCCFSASVPACIPAVSCIDRGMCHLNCSPTALLSACIALVFQCDAMGWRLTTSVTWYRQAEGLPLLAMWYKFREEMQYGAGIPRAKAVVVGVHACTWRPAMGQRRPQANVQRGMRSGGPTHQMPARRKCGPPPDMLPLKKSPSPHLSLHLRARSARHLCRA